METIDEYGMERMEWLQDRYLKVMKELVERDLSSLEVTMKNNELNGLQRGIEAIMEERERLANPPEPKETLRDKLAMAALSGMTLYTGAYACEHVELLAQNAYDYADAMLEEREKRNEGAGI